MNSRSTFWGIIFSLLVIISASCSQNKEIGDFASRFAGFIADNQRDSIIAFYPAAEYTDDYRLNFTPDNLKISKQDDDGTYEINYGDGVIMIVRINDNKKIEVIESRGLFRYSENRLNFAEKTGAPIKNISDEKLAKIMIQVDALSSELFNEFVKNRKDAIKNLGYTITKEPEFGMDYGSGYYTLRNTTDEPIGGDEYELTVEYTNIQMLDHPSTTTEIKPGKDLPPKESVKVLEGDFTWRSGYELKAITMHTPTQESFFKHYKPTGDEYSNYIRVHGNEVTKKDVLSYGPYSIVGKLGGKYPIHMSLEKGMKNGSYYYDKSGSKNTLNLHVKSFNSRTGELVIEETNNKREVTGTFTGILSPDSYVGQMTSFQGKTYDFNLDIIK